MALKPCKECKTEVSTKASKCPSCGVSNPGNKITEVSGAIVLMLVAAIVLPFMIASTDDSGESSDSSSSRYCDDVLLATNYGRDLVRQKLSLIPESEFQTPWGTMPDTTPVGDCEFIYKDVVSWNNGRGRMDSVRFTAGIKFTKDSSTWKLLYLEQG